MHPPVDVALAQTVHALPRGPGWRYEPKFDGWRLLAFRDGAGVVLQARSQRILTGAFPDLVEALAILPSGTVLDGEALVIADGVISFEAMQRRALSRRAASLASRWPASYAVFDVLSIEGQDCRSHPYAERRALLLDVLAPLGPPLQPVPVTADEETALEWYEGMRAVGVEGLMCKSASAPYRSGRTRAWLKYRHAAVEDGVVVGVMGPLSRPRVAAVQLGDESPRLSAKLEPSVSVQLARSLAALPQEGWPAPGGGRIRAVPPRIVVEVRRGTTRGAGPLRVTRVRSDQ